MNHYSKPAVWYTGSDFTVSKLLSENILILNQLLPFGKSFDLIQRELYLGKSGEIRALWIGINGFCVTEILEKIFSSLQKRSDAQNPEPEDSFDLISGDPASLTRFSESRLGIAQLEYSSSYDEILSKLTSGNSVLFADGFGQAVIMDTRAYHSRGVEEPALEKMTRGARDGFIEVLLTNVNLIRRRIRSPHLVFELHTIGKTGKNDTAVAYLRDRSDPELVRKTNEALEKLNITALTMGTKSLEELLVKKRWWNPMPSLQLTERPDVAASYLAEGYVLILADNTPMALILPSTIFQFTQTAEDYYKNPLVGTYLRLIRFLCIPAALLFLPLFLMLAAYYPQLAAKWGLISTASVSRGRLFFYALAAEFFLALFQYSASLSSDRFSGALSIVGGLLIGDMAVNLHWSSPEILFYGGITLLATLSVSCAELSDALRLYRMFLILCVFAGGPPGFLAGLTLILLSIFTTPTFAGYSYFWPLIPWNGKALVNLLLRTPTAKAQPSKVWKRSR